MLYVLGFIWWVVGFFSFIGCWYVENDTSNRKYISPFTLNTLLLAFLLGCGGPVITLICIGMWIYSYGDSIIIYHPKNNRD